MSVYFNNNYIIAQANAAIVSIDLGFASADNLTNNQTTTTTVTGTSTWVITTFKDNNSPPLRFTVTQEVTFSDGADITITGGGPNDDVIEATDTSGNRAVWQVVGR